MAANGGLGLAPAQIIDANFSSAFATIYLLVVSAAIFVCCLSIMAATIRLCFGMSRDNTLPFSKPLARVSPRLHTPVWTCITIAVLSAVPFLKYAGVPIIAIAATGMIYLSYFLGNIVILRARAWPRVASNPEPVQTGGLLTFGINFLNHIPILWTVAIGIALIGAIYYFAVGRRKEFAPIIAPAGDDAPLVTEAGAPREG
jgi:amino acid transporter